MASTTIKDISALIVAKLQALESSSEPVFKQVVGYATNKFTGYPAATVLPTGGSSGAIKDTNRNIRTFSFEVTLYQEQSLAGRTQEEANDIMRDACDIVIEAFDKDKNFNYEVSRVKVVKMNFDYQVAAGTYVFATFIVECEVLVPNYS